MTLENKSVISNLMSPILRLSRYQPSKPILLCAPSQKGLFWEAPQRQRATFSFFSSWLPSLSVMAKSPVMRIGPLANILMSTTLVGCSLVETQDFASLPSSFKKQDNAPDGQVSTVAIISAVGAPVASIHGRCLGRNTLLSPLAQLAAWEHRCGCHTMVTSPLLYSFLVFFSLMFWKLEVRNQ